MVPSNRPESDEKTGRGKPHMQPARGTGHGVWDKLRRNRVLLVMIAPAVLFFLVNNYIPMAGIILAFKE